MVNSKHFFFFLVQIILSRITDKGLVYMSLCFKYQKYFMIDSNKFLLFFVQVSVC